MKTEELKKLITEFMGFVYVPEDSANYLEWNELMLVVERIDRTPCLSNIKREYYYCVRLGGSVVDILDSFSGKNVVHVTTTETDWKKSTCLAVVEFINWYNNQRAKREERSFEIDGEKYMGSETKARERFKEYLKDNERNKSSSLLGFETWVENNCEVMRECDECKKDMEEGYVIGGGQAYYCTDKCLHKHYSKEEWTKMHKEGDEYNYWTQWEA